MNMVQISYRNCYDPKAETIDAARVLVATGDCAEPTSRLLAGSEDHGYAEEWQEPAVLPDGRKCYRMYLFDAEDIADKDPEFYPWDDDHVRRIILVD